MVARGTLNGVSLGPLISPTIQVGDPQEYKEKTPWVNFKRVVWHASFYKLLESIEEASKSGHWVNCGDGISRHIFPLILILAADYEEQ